MKKLLILAVLIFGIGFFFYFDLGQHLNLENLKTSRDQLEIFYQNNKVVMIFGYIAVYMMIGLFLLPGSTFLTLGAGVIFGPVLGVFVVNIGATLGATLAFLVARYLLRDWVDKHFGNKVKGMNDHLCQNALNGILFFRLVTLFPFFAVNIGLSLSQVKLKYFVLGTMFGILPATAIYANAGSHLASIESFSDVMSFRVLGALTLLGVLALIPIVYKAAKTGKNSC
jgi:uncharacterized membrane protein YdjX (TVP38/TMEM64 family)